MEWQPIETAPKDGTWFMIATLDDGKDGYEIGCYDPMRMKDYVPVGDGLFREETTIIHEWRGFNNMHRGTHWIPLPEPPKP